jgi:hypothetical protein
VVQTRRLVLSLSPRTTPPFLSNENSLNQKMEMTAAAAAAAVAVAVVEKLLVVQLKSVPRF